MLKTTPTQVSQIKISMGEKKLKILFIPEVVTDAHLYRTLTLAQSIKTKYNVIFAASEYVREIIEKESIPFFSIPTMKREEFLFRLDKGKPIYTMDILKNYVTSELLLFDNVSPDIVIGDFRLSLSISCEHWGVPYVNIVNAHWSPFYKQIFSLPDTIDIKKVLGDRISTSLFLLLKPIIFRTQVKAINELRKQFGLSGIGELREVYTYGTYTLYPDVPSLFPTRQLPKNHMFIGPIMYQSPTPMPEWWEKCISAKKTLIYISLGSSGDPSLYHSILTTIKNLPVIGIVSTANKYQPEPDIKEAENIFIANYLPAMDIIKESSLVICNGGSGTVYQALSCGVPVIGLPRNMDQYLIMNQLEKSNYGKLIRKGDCYKKNLRETIITLLEDKKIKENVYRISKEIKRYDAIKNFGIFLKSLEHTISSDRQEIKDQDLLTLNKDEGEYVV